MSAAEGDPRPSFSLRVRRARIELGEDGVHHPTSAGGRGHTYSRYADLTHVALTPRSLWIATGRRPTALLRRIFADRGDPARLVEALRQRVAALPDGAARIARMGELDRMAHEPRRAVATWTLALLCTAVFALEFRFAELYDVGYSSRAFVADGDWWRLLTAGLLHGFVAHLVLNLLCLLFFGWLVERALGTARVVVVMGVSQIVAMAAAAVAQPGAAVIGASGIVAGLVGALLYMELRLGSDLPAWWRLPRWLFALLVAVILLQGLLDRMVPFIAKEAHVGGFAAGFTTLAFLVRRHRVHEAAGPRLRAASAAVALATLAAVGAAAGSLLAPGDFRARHAARLAGLPGITPDELNNQAWTIAIDPEATGEQLDAALSLAERAVRETERRDATILDTLAEVQFQLGRGDLAVLTIDEALLHSPGASLSRYLREQRRRFTGERDPDDRPPPPGLPWPQDPDPAEPPDSEGIRV